jgi:hypothetical protein
VVSRDGGQNTWQGATAHIDAYTPDGYAHVTTLSAVDLQAGEVHALDGPQQDAVHASFGGEAYFDGMFVDESIGNRQDGCYAIHFDDVGSSPEEIQVYASGTFESAEMTMIAPTQPAAGTLASVVAVDTFYYFKVQNGMTYAIDKTTCETDQNVVGLTAAETSPAQSEITFAGLSAEQFANPDVQHALRRGIADEYRVKVSEVTIALVGSSASEGRRLDEGLLVALTIHASPALLAQVKEKMVETAAAPEHRAVFAAVINSFLEHYNDMHHTGILIGITSTSAPPVPSHNQPHCHDVDCGGTSTCANGLDKYTCSCAAGWTGGGDNAVCTDIDECEGVDCGGTSTCANGLDKYTCSCAAGWTGPRECAGATVDLGDSYGDGWNGAVAHIDSYGATAWEHRTDVQLSMDDGNSALGVPLGCLPDGCYRMHFEELARSVPGRGVDQRIGRLHNPERKRPCGG